MNYFGLESIQCRVKKQIEKAHQHASIQGVHAILYWPPAETHKTPTNPAKTNRLNTNKPQRNNINTQSQTKINMGCPM